MDKVTRIVWAISRKQINICHQCAMRLAHTSVKQRTQSRSVPNRYKLLPIPSNVQGERKTRLIQDMPLKENTLNGMRKVLPDGAKPTAVQAIGIPEIVKGSKRILMAAETGSGKTLAYLSGIVDRLKPHQQVKQVMYSETRPDLERSRPRRPQCIVVVPTSILVNQIEQVARQLCADIGLQVRKLEGKRHRMDGSETIRSSDIYDILISTPDALMHAIDTKQSRTAAVSLASAQYLVMDETDTLFQQDFLQSSQHILDAFEKANETQGRTGQIVFVSATIPASLSERLNEMYPDLVKITTPNLHRIVAASSIAVRDDSVDLSKLQQQFVEADQGSTKQQLMLDIIKKHTFRPDKGRYKMLVFCNRRQGVELLMTWLEARGVGDVIVAMTGDTRTRSKILAEFIDPSSGKDVLITTDIMSRGIDMHVDHVVLFDTPRSTRDYLHRVGRTARAGNKGKATIFVTKQGKGLIEAVKKGLRTGRVIE